MKKSYQILTIKCKETSQTWYWVQQVSVFFKWEIKQRIHGKYTDDHAGIIPFFDWHEAQRKIKELKKSDYENKTKSKSRFGRFISKITG